MSDLFDYQLLKSLVISKETFDKYGETITFKDVHLTNIHNQIGLYYLHNNVEAIEANELTSILIQVYKDDVYTRLVPEIYSVEVNERWIASLQDALLNRYIIANISELTYNKMEAQEFDTLEDIYEILNRQEAEEDVEESSLSLGEILKENTGYSWPWKDANQYLGLLPSSTHGLVFGRVEVGKTAFITNCSVHFCSQGAVVLHLNNEDPIGKLMERYYMIRYGCSKEKIMAGLDRASKAFSEEYAGKLFIYDTAGLTLNKIKKLVRKHKADVVLIDQLDGMSAENDPNTLEKLYMNVRHIAKDEDTRIISVTQASAGEHTWLGMGDVHNSKVGKPAALDYMIGIGGQTYAPLQRYISLPKNKLTGLHSQFMLEFEPSTMRIK